MKIYPQDLGRVGYRVMLYLRAQTQEGLILRAQSPGEAEAAEKKLEKASALMSLTPLRRVWLRGSGVSEDTARHAPPAFAVCRRAIWIGSPGLASTLFLSLLGTLLFIAFIAAGFQITEVWSWLCPLYAMIGASAIYHAVIKRPRRVFRRLHSPLTEQDVTLMMQQARDPLAREFLTVIELLLPLPTMADADTEKNLRGALATLGAAIEELPQQAPQAVQGDPLQIREQASRLTETARQETDMVVAASLERRAQSLARRSQTMSSIAVLLRRNQALRDEVSEQIEALRTGISALSVGSRQGAHELADLAVSIQRVAAEASAIALAQTEIETLETAAYAEADGPEFDSLPYQALRIGQA